MKKLLLIIMIISLSLVLFACKDKKSNEPVIGNENTEIAQTDEEGKEEYFSGTVEYENTDFTDRTDFKVNKDESLSNVEYDRIFLLSRDMAQLDLKFDNGKLGTLMVLTAGEAYAEEGATSKSIMGVDVTYYEAIDGIKHYSWVKNETGYEFVSEEEFSDEELSKIIAGYSIETGED